MNGRRLVRLSFLATRVSIGSIPVGKGQMYEKINLDRRRFLVTAATTIAAAELSTVGSSLRGRPSRATIEGELPSLGGATGWLNSPPLTAAGLRGKVVLVDFWTYTCINWLRTLPYVRAWAEKYKDHGLVVIGVHTPEFAFEQERRERSPGREGHADRLPDRDRQRLRGSGMRSATSTGRPSISSTRRGGSGITSSARASTSSRK